MRGQSFLLAAFLLPLVWAPASALPFTLPLPEKARGGVQFSGREKDGVLELSLTLDERVIGAKVAEVRLTVVDQLPEGTFRQILDLRLGTDRGKDGKLVVHFSLERRMAAAASVALVLDQKQDVPGGTWYVFALDEFLDLFNDLPPWKLRQKLRRYESTAPMRGRGNEKPHGVDQKLRLPVRE